ncbi:MAG: hypothetical protein JW794_10560 [Candidatus Cloacimonetes bacterium]|nr:hypothetical protein [Candidatus Cloacimonadota bacterium]
MKKTDKDEKSSYSLIIKGFIKLIFNFLNHVVKDWENKFSNRGYKELSQKYDVIEKKVFNDIHNLKNKIEKLSVRLFWLNLLAALLFCCVVVELILIIQLG